MPFLRKIISVCESKENKRDFYFSRETCTKIIVIDLIIVKLFEVCPWFSPSKERVFHVNICVFVYDYFFGLLIYIYIFFYLRNTHIYGEEDEIREYTHMPIPKLHETVSVRDQVINPFSISHLTNC